MKKHQKKKLMLGLVAASVAVTPLMLTGCSNGDNHQLIQNNTQWYYDTVNVIDGKLSGNVDFDAVNGDFYIDVDDNILYQLKDGSWQIVMENFGATGQQGNSVSVVSVEKTNTVGLVDTYTITFSNGTTSTFTVTNGKDGQDGKEGTSVYVGYDGYIWQGAERTTFKLEDTIVDENIFEDTIKLYGNKYFAQNVVATKHPIALMNHYCSNIGKTGYSGTQVTELTIYVEQTGILEIGTAKVKDVVASRLNGLELQTHTTTYQVTAGKNLISLNLNIESTDTLVIGGGNSNVNIYTYEKVNGEDEYGYYTICDKQVRSELFEETNDIKDKLVIETKCLVVAQSLIDFSEQNKIVVGKNDISNWRAINISNYPLTISNFASLSGNKITKIVLPIATVQSITENTTFMLSVYSNSELEIGSDKPSALRTYTVSIPYTEWQNPELITTTANNRKEGWYNVNQWVEVDLTAYNIILDEDETILYGDVSDTVVVAYENTKTVDGLNLISIGSNYNVVTLVTGPGVTLKGSLYIDFYGYQTDSDLTIQGHLEKLKQQEEKECQKLEIQNLAQKLTGKSVSILGDSISTYQNVSNNSSYNETISNNSVYYTNQMRQSDTYWQQVLDLLNLELCVNNSWSGGQLWLDKKYGTSTVNTPGLTRCEELANKNGENPDIILAYIGTNDYNYNYENSNWTLGSVKNIDWSNLIVEQQDGTFIYAEPASFAEAYAVMLHKLKNLYRDANVFCFTIPVMGRRTDVNAIDDLLLFNNVIVSLAQHFDCQVVDLYHTELSNYTNTSIIENADVHPTTKGMDIITDEIIKTFLTFYIGE